LAFSSWVIPHDTRRKREEIIRSSFIELFDFIRSVGNCSYRREVYTFGIKYFRLHIIMKRSFSLSKYYWCFSSYIKTFYSYFSFYYSVAKLDRIIWIN
jgi:hypothetical protein